MELFREDRRGRVGGHQAGGGAGGHFAVLAKKSPSVSGPNSPQKETFQHAVLLSPVSHKTSLSNF